QHDHRQEQCIRDESIERIFDCRWVGEHLRALPEIIQNQRRQHETEPGGLNGQAAEMAEVGIERLAAGNDQKYRAQGDESDVTMVSKKRYRVERIDSEQHARIVTD